VLLPPVELDLGNGLRAASGWRAITPDPELANLEAGFVQIAGIVGQRRGRRREWDNLGGFHARGLRGTPRLRRSSWRRVGAIGSCRRTKS